MAEEEHIKPPNWLENLEKQRVKRVQRKLGHETGAGAPCMTCGDKCPGLDLHFWRKICKNCKCGKECHNIEDDDIYGFVQFQLLGTKPIKSKGFVLPGRSDPMNLEWMPQGVKTVVERYLDEMPPELLPVSGSEAAQERRRRLQMQVPAHDIDASLCDSLTAAEMHQLDEYVAHIRQHCVGQGKVTELPLHVAGRHVVSQPNARLLSQRVPTQLTNSEVIALQPANLADNFSHLNLRDQSEMLRHNIPKHLATSEPVTLQPASSVGRVTGMNDNVESVGNIDTISNDVSISNSEPVSAIRSSISSNLRPNSNDYDNANSNVSLVSCHECKGVFNGGTVIISVERTDAKWHPQCFKCNKCKELLIDLLYFYHKASGQVYCGRDFAEIKGIPRCSACDELIFTREHCLAEGSTFHVKHFCCWECDTPLAGQKYLMENNQPMCLPCFETISANKCSSCKNIIKPHEQGVSLRGLHWHASPDCFACGHCRKNLMQANQMRIVDDRVFCTSCATVNT